MSNLKIVEVGDYVHVYEDGRFIKRMTAQDVLHYNTGLRINEYNGHLEACENGRFIRRISQADYDSIVAIIKGEAK